MDNSVLDDAEKEQQRLAQLQQELEGQELTTLLEKLMAQYKLSANQVAVSAGMDESALHKILKGENREFKAEHVDALLDDLEALGKLTQPTEKDIWRRALRVAAHLHFELYKAVEPRLRQIADPAARLRALAEYLRSQYPALAQTYDHTGGQFPAFLPLSDVLARQLLRQWEWVRVPDGYKLHWVRGDEYTLMSTDVFPKKIRDLGLGLEIKDTGFGTYTIRRKPVLPPRPAAPPVKDAPKSETRSPFQSPRWQRDGARAGGRVPVRRRQEKGVPARILD